jgi:EmrB/QacA subfamily drug resistance transporter
MTKRAYVLAFLMISTFMISIESTIVATAMPRIVAELGHFSLYSWVFSSFLLMQAISTPIYGKLADLFGRKPIFLTGIVLFLMGSWLCGLASSMQFLISARFIQGLGAGAVMPISATIVGDLYPGSERAKVQGYLSSVWGISSVVGPLAGGLIVQYLHWAWIFWINLPLGILTIIGTAIFLHEQVKKQKPSIDFGGAFLFLVAIISFMLLLLEGGSNWGWLSWPSLIALFTTVIALTLFFFWEKRASSPLIPIHLWKDRLIVVANLTTLLSGAAMVGLSSFLPTYVQGIMGYSALIAGFTLTVMSVGWSSAAISLGRLLNRLSWRTIAILGGFCLLLGSFFIFTLDPQKSPLWAAIGSLIIGLGMGLTSTTFTVSIQSSVQWEMRGSATSLNMFMRTLGSSLGSAILGSILNIRLAHLLAEQPGQTLRLPDIDAANILLDPVKRSQLTSDTLHLLQNALTESLHYVYLGLMLFALFAFVITFFFPANFQLKEENN